MIGKLSNIQNIAETHNPVIPPSRTNSVDKPLFLEGVASMSASTANIVAPSGDNTAAATTAIAKARQAGPRAFTAHPAPRRRRVTWRVRQRDENPQPPPTVLSTHPVALPQIRREFRNSSLRNPAVCRTLVCTSLPNCILNPRVVCVCACVTRSLLPPHWLTSLAIVAMPYLEPCSKVRWRLPHRYLI